MEHGVGPYIGLNEIKSPNPMTNFITISYLFNCIFYLSVSTFWIYLLRFLGLSIRIFVCAYK